MSSDSNRFDPSKLPPANCFVEVTHECNLRCKMCHLWNTKEDKNSSITTEEKIGLIRQFKDLNPDGTVVLTGGEVMRKIDEFFALTGKCNELGLTSSANTNGTYISPAIVEKLVTDGPKYLVVSLDSIHNEIHDYLRGNTGTFDNSVNAIKAYSKEKAKSGYTEKGIYTNCIVMEQNYRELEDYVAFVKEIGANGVMFQMLSRTFGLKRKRDLAFETCMPKDKADFKARITNFMHNHAKDGFVKTSQTGFSYMINYVDNPDFNSPEVCASGENSMMIDTYGNTQLCFNMHSLTGGRFLGNTRERALSEMWTSPEAEKARDIMRECRKSCGMLNCHRRN